MPMTPNIPPSNVSRPVLLVLFLMILASRVPLLGGGFGSDDDAWRNAVCALHIHDVGHYVASRAPGFPVFEGLLVLLVPWGWVATNLVIALAGVVAACIFLVVARRLHVRNAGWLTFAFAFSGVLWVHATQTMDYAVGLAFLLGSYWALLDRRHFVGGLLMALAAGCRLTMGALAAPALIMLVVRREEWRSVATFCASFAAGTIVLFVPVLVTLDPQWVAGEGMRHASKAHVTLANLPGVLRSGAVFLFGKMGALALALGLAWRLFVIVQRRLSAASSSKASSERSRSDAKRWPDIMVRRSALCFEVGSVLVVGASFLMIPYDLAYLIPILPFVLLLVGRVLAGRVLVVVALLIASEVVVMPLFDQRRLVAGRLFQEIERRRADLDATRDLASRRPSEPTVFVIGRFDTHRLLVLEPSLERTEAAWAPFYEPGVALWSRDRLRGYAAFLDAPQRAALAAQGYRIEDRTDASR